MGDWEAPACSLAPWDGICLCLAQMQKLHSETLWLCTCSLFNHVCMTTIMRLNHFVRLILLLVATVYGFNIINLWPNMP